MFISLFGFVKKGTIFFVCFGLSVIIFGLLGIADVLIPNMTTVSRHEACQMLKHREKTCMCATFPIFASQNTNCYNFSTVGYRAPCVKQRGTVARVRIVRTTNSITITNHKSQITIMITRIVHILIHFTYKGINKFVKDKSKLKGHKQAKTKILEYISHIRHSK